MTQKNYTALRGLAIAGSSALAMFTAAAGTATAANANVSPSDHQGACSVAAAKLGAVKAEMKKDDCFPKPAHHHVVRRQHEPQREAAAPSPPPAPGAAAPAPVAAALSPSPSVPPIEQSGPHLGQVYYELDQPIELPMAHASDTALDKSEQRFIDKGDCNNRGFVDAFDHPLNAHCEEHEIAKTTTVGGIVRRNLDDNKIIFVPVGEATFSVTVDVRSTHGNGWLYAALQVVQTGAQVYTGIRSVAIAEQSLSLEQNLNNQIITGINGGKFNSLFGSLGGCGNATNANGQVGNSMNANCVIGSVVNNSAVGQANTSMPTGGTNYLTGSYGTGAITTSAPVPPGASLVTTMAPSP